MDDGTGSIRDLQLAELEILRDVAAFCSEQSIEVILLGGTLLGAVRHGGFIPWDDDIDIGMRRVDYERFVSLASGGALGDRYFCQSVQTDALHYVPFVKVRKNGTRFVESNTLHLDTHKGVSIDVFPIDNVPDSWLGRVAQAAEVFVLTRCVHAASGAGAAASRSWPQRLVYRAMAVALRPIGLHRLLLNLDHTMRRYAGRRVRDVTNMAGVYGYWTEMFPTEAIDRPTTVEFEGQWFLAPAPPAEYLTRLYGDFMTPPPEDQRGTTHCVVEVSL